MPELTTNKVDISDNKPDVSPADEPNRIDVNQALKLRFENGLSYNEIAQYMGVSKQAVWERLQPFVRVLRKPGALKTYQDNKANILDATAMQVLMAALDPEKIKQAGVRSLISAWETLNKAYRLETDQSTENIAHSHVHAVSDDARDKLKKITGRAE